MLKKLLSGSTCAKCRICCGFTNEDKWEIPLVFDDLRKTLDEPSRALLTARGREYVFDMDFDGLTDGEVIMCPMAGENGCVLGDNKPFDCKIWPFRVNSLEGRRVITLSPVCEEVSSLPLKTLSEFLQKDGFAEMLFKTAQEHPDMVKPYIDGYPILAVERLRGD